MLDEKDNKTRIPYEHYKLIFSLADPVEMSHRTQIPYDEEKQIFSLRLMQKEYSVSWPDFTVKDASGEEFLEYGALILVARYLTEGRYTPAGDKALSYTDIPSGNLYYQAFKGRCLMRLAYSFGTKPEAFKSAMEKIGAEKCAMGDVGYKFEIINGFYMWLAIWAPDEDFGPSSQILYSDNFPAGFTIEDCSVCGDVAINTLKAASR